jgi:hypothetical protein
MSSSCLEPAPVELGKLRELIAVDRSDAGEARHAQSVQPLTTTVYNKPLRVVLKRRWRSDSSLRKATWTSAALALLMLVLWQAPLWSTAGAKSALRPSPTRVRPVRELRSALPLPAAQPSAHTSFVQPAALETSVRTAPVAAEPEQLSPRRRLQRADLWLRVGSARGDREARSLLESALREAPQSAHGQAALAQACLRLQDSSCARQAVKTALGLRPWRGGYRTLARKIDSAFITQP